MKEKKKKKKKQTRKTRQRRGRDKAEEKLEEIQKRREIDTKWERNKEIHRTGNRETATEWPTKRTKEIMSIK